MIIKSKINQKIKKQQGFYLSVAKLIEKIGERFTEEDYRALARRLDHDLNERITKNEFCEALLPNDVSREDLEIRHATFLEKEPDYFYNPVKTIKKVSELQLTEKRKFLNQNVNLMNQNCDNVFAGDEELKHIRAFIRNQDDVMDFATENFYRQSKSVRPMNPPEEFNKINTSNIYKNPVINTNDLNLEKTTMHSKDRMIKEGPILQNTQALYNKQQLIQTNLENSDVFRYSQSQKNNTSLFRSSPKKIFEIKDPKNNPTKKETDQLAQSLNEIKNGSLRNSSVRPSLKLNNSKFSHLFQTK